MYPNGQSDVHPDAVKLLKKLHEDYEPSKYFSELDLDIIVYGCESPIEQMLAVMLAFFAPDFMHIAKQVEVVWFKDLSDQQKEHIFRPDFIIGFNLSELTPDWEYASRGDWWDTSAAYQWLPFFAVECDGRDYHNDHIAIERDKQRDRIFQARGMPVLRFTGSEIYNDAIDCADQIIDLFKFNLKERLKPGVWPEELVGHGKDTKILLGKKWPD